MSPAVPGVVAPLTEFDDGSGRGPNRDGRGATSNSDGESARRLEPASVSGTCLGAVTSASACVAETDWALGDGKTCASCGNDADAGETRPVNDASSLSPATMMFLTSLGAGGVCLIPVLSSKNFFASLPSRSF